MYPIRLSLEVQNSFDHPRQSQLLAEEISDMAARIEDTTEFSEEDVFLSGAFDNGIEGMEDQLPTYERWVAELSRDFPDLVFALDVSEEVETAFSDYEEHDLLFRLYIRDGRKQKAMPYKVVPDFDPDEAGEEVA